VPGKTAADAASYFHDRFRQSLSVITDTYLHGIREGAEHLLFFEPPARLATTKSGFLYIDVLQTFATVQTNDGSFRAHTTGYQYAVMEAETDSTEYGIVTYHWHPGRTPKLRWPHLHVIPRERDKYLGNAIHLPTSRICIEDFVHLFIRDFHVRPRSSHEDWKKILTDNKTSFVKFANWWAYSLNQQLISN